MVVYRNPILSYGVSQNTSCFVCFTSYILKKRFSACSKAQNPQLPHCSTDLDETGITIHGLLRSFVGSAVAQW